METTAPALSEGEIQIAAIHIVGKAPYQLTLLPGEVEDVTHQAATEWAASISGVLPNRHEQALLFAHFRTHFKCGAHWSDQLHESDPDYAWYEYFDSGIQDYYRRDLKLRARAVRRLPI